MATRAKLRNEQASDEQPISLSEIMKVLNRIEIEVKKIGPLTELCNNLQVSQEKNTEDIIQIKTENTELKNRLIALEHRIGIE